MNGAQVRMARAALKMNVRALAAAAVVSPNTITRIEADLPANASTMAAIRRSLEAAGVEFLSEDGAGGPGVRFRKGFAGAAAAPASASKRPPRTREAPRKSTRPKRR
jgi:transcriptional regulator with XRE-family HTH domain